MPPEKAKATTEAGSLRDDSQKGKGNGNDRFAEASAFLCFLLLTLYALSLLLICSIYVQPLNWRLGDFAVGG
jgi:hypothetical protein